MFFQSSVRPRQQEICGRWLSFFTLVRISGALRQLFRNFWIPQNDLWSHVPTTDRTKPPFVKHRQFLKSERFFFMFAFLLTLIMKILLKSLIRICTISRLNFEGRREKGGGVNWNRLLGKFQMIFAARCILISHLVFITQKTEVYTLINFGIHVDIFILFFTISILSALFLYYVPNCFLSISSKGINRSSKNVDDLAPYHCLLPSISRWNTFFSGIWMFAHYWKQQVSSEVKDSLLQPKTQSLLALGLRCHKASFLWLFLKRTV